MNYKLVVTDRAKQDRDRAFDWYSTKSSKGIADRWYKGDRGRRRLASSESASLRKSARERMFSV